MVNYSTKEKHGLFILVFIESNADFEMVFYTEEDRNKRIDELNEDNASWLAAQNVNSPLVGAKWR